MGVVEESESASRLVVFRGVYLGRAHWLGAGRVTLHTGAFFANTAAPAEARAKGGDVEY